MSQLILVIEDHYEEALKELLAKKQAGQKITPVKEHRPTNG
jgi:non-homologous end joining protein Ku